MIDSQYEIYSRVVVPRVWTADGESSINVTCTRERSGCAVWVVDNDHESLAQFYTGLNARELAIEHAVAMTRMLQVQYESEKRLAGGEIKVRLTVVPVEFPKFEIDAVEPIKDT